nr:MAG TPA: hypothetical protein [Caudoviricetes sp.]
MSSTFLKYFLKSKYFLIQTVTTDLLQTQF